MKEQYPRRNPNHEENRGGQIWQSKRILLQELAVSKDLRMFLGRVGQCPSKRGPKDTPNGPHQGHDTKRARLQLLLRNHLRDHGPDDADVSVHKTQKRTCKDQRDEGVREAEHHREDHGEGQAEEDDGFAAEVVRGPAPGDAHEALAAGDDGGGDTDPFGNFILGHAHAFDHLRLQGS